MNKPLIEIINISHSFDGEQVLNNFSLEVYPGEFLTLLGSSGCGKTTLLNMIAGFITPDQGDIVMNGNSITALPPQNRNIHTVFQSYALFPHMNIFDNIAFGLQCNKEPKESLTKKVDEVLSLIKLQGFESKYPHQLSGGQQQRVAIARAIVNKPKVLLLDESLSSLDYRLRKTMQSELRQLQRKLNMTFFFVTHDQEEALSMSDRIVLLNKGCIEQVGTPRELYENPKNLTVARFIGEINIFTTFVENLKDNNVQITLSDRKLSYQNTIGAESGDEVHLIIRPEDIRVWKKNEVTSDEKEHMIPGVISDIIYKGSTVDLKVRLKSGQLIHATEFFDEDDEDLEYEYGQQVWIHWLPGWELLLAHED